MTREEWGEAQVCAAPLNVCTLMTHALMVNYVRYAGDTWKGAAVVLPKATFLKLFALSKSCTSEQK